MMMKTKIRSFLLGALALSVACASRVPAHQPFKATNPYDQNGGYALETITKPQTGDADQAQAVLTAPEFLPPLTNLAPFKWEWWAAPADNQPGIIAVVGIGGLHAGLIEFISAGPGSLNILNGNMYMDDIGQGISFFSYDGCWPTEPCHGAVLWDGTNVLLEVNGLTSGKFPTPVGAHRLSQNTPSGGTLCFNSNGHAARGGLLQQFRAWDGLLSDPPVLPKVGSNYEVWPGPESIFGPGYAMGNGSITPASFLMNFSQPAMTPADLSPAGLLGKFHHGALVNMRVTNSLIQGQSGNVYPRPRYVPAPLFPSGLVTTPRPQPIFHKPTPAQPSPPAVPGALLVADDFSDGWNTYAFDNGTLFENQGLLLPQLRPTKYGPPLPYDQHFGYTSDQDSAPWGTDNSGNAVAMGVVPSTATVDVTVADYDVLVQRVGPAAPAQTNGELGIAFRKQDNLNYYTLQAVYDPFQGEAMHLWLFKVANGVTVGLDSGQSCNVSTGGDTFTWMKAHVKGATFVASIDDGAGNWVDKCTVTGQTSYSTASRAGLYGASSLVGRQTTRQRTAALAIYTAP